MRFTKFAARKLNDLDQINIEFDEQINFLIGINGCGKTTVLRAMTALVTPDLDWLFSSSFESIFVEFELGKDVGSVETVKSDDGIEILFRINSRIQSRDLIPREAFDRLGKRNFEQRYREDGEDIRLIEEVTMLGTSFDVVRTIRDLPTPIYLGLDRTTLPAVKDPTDLRHERLARSRRSRITLRTFLDESVAQSAAIVHEAMYRAQQHRSRRAVALRESILRSIFADDQESYKIPTNDDIRKYEKYRRSIKSAYSLSGIKDQHLYEKVDDFFDRLTEAARGLTHVKSVADIFGSQKREDEAAQKSYFQWNSLRPKLPIVSHIEKDVNSYNKEQTEIFEGITRYKQILNAFFTDSHKILDVSESGEVEIKTTAGRGVNLYQLSSGERQLFVLISNLLFNRDRLQANVLIIDEPELSLHLKWQEMFVDSLIEANPKTQMIFATHSPSIILNRDENCIELA